MRHYPRHDVSDTRSRTRFYYHSHPISTDVAEHGHFHIFVERDRIFHHLAALSLDATGHPVRWFSTNRWVTGETIADTPFIQQSVATFNCQTRGLMAPVARWVSAMVLLYQQEIIDLTRRRQARTNNLTSQELEQFETNRDIHVLDTVSIILQDRIQDVIHLAH
jgi:predicted XRE-type DNA-binding protein